MDNTYLVINKYFMSSEEKYLTCSNAFYIGIVEVFKEIE